MDLNVHGSIVYNYQDTEIIQGSINRWMDNEDSLGLQRVRHDWAPIHTHTHMHIKCLNEL